MKLYHLSQSIERGYDTYSDMVVCAESEEVARNIHPAYSWVRNEEERKACWNGSYGSGWARRPDQVTAVYLGEADDSVEEGIICVSFHAG
jgi:hypothetical protein